MSTGYCRKLERIPPLDTFFADNLGPILSTVRGDDEVHHQQRLGGFHQNRRANTPQVAKMTDDEQLGDCGADKTMFEQRTCNCAFFVFTSPKAHHSTDSVLALIAASVNEKFGTQIWYTSPFLEDFEKIEVGKWLRRFGCPPGIRTPIC